MTRPRLPTFAGATGTALPPDVIAGLDFDRYALQVKEDGVYVEITTDTRGRIDSVRSQLGHEYAPAADLIGIFAGPPHSTFAAEHESHTEAGIAAASERGFACAHLLDCTRLAGIPLARQPYAERHGSLYRAASWVEGEGLGRRREWTLDARGDAHALSASAAPSDVGGTIDRGNAGSGKPRMATRTGNGPGGRYVAAIPRDLRRLPIAPLVRGRADAIALWGRIERERLEGAVAVDLRAPVGRGKKKIKITDTLGCTVLRADASCSEVATDRGLTFTVPGVAEVGAIVEVRHHGFYGSGLPRFPSMVRVRLDKMPVPDRGALIEWRA